MATLTIQINCDNAAFGDHPEIEVKRILQEYAKQLEYGSIFDYPVLRDYNGNTVGMVELTDD